MNTETKQHVDDDIEGDDQDLTPILGWGDYPLDSVFVRTDKRTVHEVVKRIQAGRFIMDPDFQRDFIWDKRKQSQLIESCLMRIPLPVFYLAENNDGKIIVVDGLQRLTTFSRFMNDKFALTGLGEAKHGASDESSSLNGNRFSDLPIKLQERIEDTQLTLYILDPKAPERAKLDIFERVNGGVPLTRQQMRNCLFSGSATKWLKRAAQNKKFLSATGRSLNSQSMRDREAINRFCAFYLLKLDMYKGDMDKYLADALIKMNELSEDKLDTMFQDFIFAMKCNEKILGKHAFRKSMFYDDVCTSRSIINISLFDVFSVVMTEMEEEYINDNTDLIRSKIILLNDNEAFIDSITIGTNDSRKVKSRHSILRETLLG